MNSAKNLNLSLDPQGVRFLEKRLLAGEISPHVFKDILKYQMVKQYFQDYVHPFARVWGKMMNFITTRLKFIRKQSPFMAEAISSNELKDIFSRAHHKHF